jgi:hypothetical protein
MKGCIEDWKEFLKTIDIIESIQIGEDLFTDKSQMKERAYEAYKNHEDIEIFL